MIHLFCQYHGSDRVIAVLRLIALTGVLLGGPQATEAAKAKKEGRTADATATPSSSGEPDFNAFRVIIDRNIFNPNRTGRSRATEDAAPRVDVVALVGTMQSEQGLVAFFDSTNSAYRKQLREGEKIADFTIKKISPDGVELDQGNEMVALRVNQQLRRPEGGEWKVGMREGVRPEAAAPADKTTREIPSDASDVLRRLMEKRNKQLKQ